MSAPKPTTKPNNPCFGSGPCAKRAGYSLDALKDAALGRSHRSALGKGKIELALNLTRKILEIPPDYLVGIVPGSDTGAFEMAMWNLLGCLPVDVFYWETFGKGWLKDAKTLKLQVNAYEAEFGKLPDLSKAKSDHDIIFTWNGTTSGVKVPNADWIADDRKGLTLCDATSAVFAMTMPWSKLDVVTFSWQKVLGGEAAHGMLVLSPAAQKRIEEFVPPHPVPKLFQLRNEKGKLNKEIFGGSVINTISLLALEDYLDALHWADNFGLSGLVNKSQNNLKVIEDFVLSHSQWIDFLPESKEIRSNTSVCLRLQLSGEQIKQLTSTLAKEKVAFDIDSYRDAPPGLRIWCGSTVEAEDLLLLLPWIHWAYHSIVNKS